MDQFSQLQADVRRIRLELESVSGQLAANQSPSLGSPDTSFHPIPTTTPPSVVNQIRNGEFSHSVDTWNNPPTGSPTLDVGKECAFWFSNDAPVAGQVLDFTTSLTSAANETLKAFGSFGGVHSTYDPAYCDWDRAKGQARLTGTKSLDAPFPNNRIVTNTRAVEYFGALVALRNNTIRVPVNCRIYCGVWDNTNSAPRPDWIAGSAFSVDSDVRGTPPSTTERRYKVFAFTDRGFTYLSTEETVLAAPSDADFATCDVYLTWGVIPGILQYAVYRFDVVAAKYRLLRDSIIGGSYADNGSVLDGDTGGYPAATSDTPICYTATNAGDLDNLPVDGEPWAVLTLNPPVPPDYDQSTTTAEEVLRVGLTVPLDREMSDAISTATSSTIESATAAFTALDTGRTAMLYDANGNILHGPEVITFVDTTHITFATAVSTSNVDAVLYIVEGGDHGLLLDAAHISYVPGAAFAPYPDDLNRLQNGGQDPIAAPSSSSQGGAGGGGIFDPGEGGIGCIALDSPVVVSTGYSLETLMYKAVRLGESLFSGDLRSNQVVRKLPTRTLNLHILRVKVNWLYDVELRCSPQHPVIHSKIDRRGIAVQNLRPGDTVLISLNHHVESRSVREVIDTGEAADVATFSLWPGNVYSAGSPHFRGRLKRLIARLFKIPIVGILSHNRKIEGSSV